MTKEEEIILKKSLDKMFKNSDEQAEHLSNVKKEFNNNPVELINYASQGYNLEDKNLPLSFKRFSFFKSDSFSIGTADYYGNIEVYTEFPKTLSTICLMIIHNLSEYFDRYGVILHLIDIFKANDNYKDL